MPARAPFTSCMSGSIVKFIFLRASEKENNMVITLMNRFSVVRMITLGYTNLPKPFSANSSFVSIFP